MPEIFYLLISLACYIFAFYHLWHKSQRTLTDSTPSNTMLLGIMGLGLIAHGLTLLQTMLTGEINLALGLLFSTVMLFVLLGYLLYSLIQSQHISLGIIILPICIVALSIGYFFPGEPLLLSSLPVKIRWHVLFAIPAFIFICLAFSQAILLIIAEKKLRNPKSSNGFIGLPALDSMDNFLYLLTIVSFIFINLNIIVGSVAVITNANLTLSIDHHLVLSILSWLCLLSLLIGRKHSGWRASIAAKWTIGAFILLFLAYFGTRFVTQVILT